ncbi:MAG: SAF domain-containing protein [Myxococcaceae bacterium]
MSALRFFLAGFFGAALIVFAVRVARTEPPPRAGVGLVAKVDAPSDQPLSRADLEAVEVPGRFLHDGILTLDDWPAVASRPLQVPVLSGDLLTVQHFAGHVRTQALQNCVAALQPRVEAEVRSLLDAEVAALSAGTEPVDDDPRFPSTGTVRVVVAARPVPRGTTLEAASLQVVEWPAELGTPSLVLEGDRDAVLGARLLRDAQPGDALRWQHLSRDPPRGVVACTEVLRETGHAARVRLASEKVSTLELEVKP